MTFRCLCLGVLALIAAQADPPGALRRFEYFRIQMGTKVRILLYAVDEEHARRSASAAFDRIQQLDEILSDYNPESELMLLCRTGHERPVSVSGDLFLVLRRSLHYSHLTGGAFDVTVGPMVELWRWSKKMSRLPDPSSLEKARERVGYGKIHLLSGTPFVHLRRKGMKLDLGGIAVGYAVDQALAVLAQNEIASALVDAGGDIGVSEAPPGQKGWRILLQDPRDRTEKGETTLILRKCAVTTSGDTERFVEIEGVRYSHIVDPKTGLGVRNSASVTVIAPDCTAADALATALSVLPPERGIGLADSQKGIAAYIVARDGNTYREYVSSRMHAYLNPPTRD